MPTYEYQCSHCQKMQEAFQRMQDAPLTTCPACGEAALQRRLFSAPSFQLKGKGWYKTDYTATTPAAAESKESTASKETKEPKETKETPAEKPAASTGEAA